MFLGFVNFYQRFIQGFSRIATLLNSMLKTILRALRPVNSRRYIGGGNGKIDDNDKIREMEENLSKLNPPGARFLTPKPSIVFICLRKAFTKTPILYYFDSECHIQIKTNASDFGIGRIFTQLTLGYVTYTNPNLSTSEIAQWHIVAFFSQKMISAKTKYKSYNGELLVIIEVFKT